MTFDNAKNALLRVSEKCPGNKNSGNVSDMIQVKEEMMDHIDQSPVMYNEGAGRR